MRTKFGQLRATRLDATHASIAALVIAGTLAAWSGPAHAAAALGRTGSGTGTTTAITIAMSGALTSGSLLVGIVTQSSVGGSFGTIAAPAGWTCPAGLSAAQSTTVQTSICYLANNSSTGTTVGTWSVGSTAGTKFGVQVGEFTGITTTSPLDGTGTNSAAASNSISVSATAGNGPELSIAAFANDDSTNPSTMNGGTFTTLGSDINTSNAFRAHVGYQLSTPAGSVSESVSIGGNKKPNLAAVMATFTVVIPTYYWIGGLSGCPSGSAWSSTSCWATSSGGASSGGTPTASSGAVFDGNGTGDCTINSAATALTLSTSAGYTGTITHSSGNVSLAGALTIAAGTFNSTATSATSIRTNQGGTYVGDLIVSGGTFSAAGAVLAFRSINVSGSTSSVNTGTSATSTNNSGTVTLSGGSVTFGTGGLTLADAFTVSGAATTIGNAAFTVPGAAAVSSGSLTFGSGNVAFNGGLTISGTGAVTLGTGTTQTATTLTVSSTSASALTFATGTTFTTTDVVSQSAGTITANNATLTFGSGVAGGSDGFTMTGGTFAAGTSTLTVGITGKNGGQTTTINGSSATFNGGSGTQHFYGVLNVTAGTMSLGTADMVSSRNGGSANTDKQVIVGASGTLNLWSSFAFPSTTAMTLAGKINGGIGTVTFTPAVTITGTYDAQSSTTTFGAAVTLNSSSAVFWGGTNTTTFSVAPTFTSGTFQVPNGSTGVADFTAGATFASGMTLAFASNGGTLSAPGGQTFTINGTVTSSAGNVSTRPKITRSSGTAGVTVAFGSTAILNVNGLEFNNMVSTGVTIADGATYTTLKNLKFLTNVANSTSSGATHLSITSSNTGGTKVITIPGCYFDATAQYNVTLSGVTGSTGVRAILEYQSATVNGARGGPSFDLDADTNGDNVADTTTTPRFGAVVEWTYASPTDTAGTAVGYPTAAFDWNTFQWYGVYVAYKDTTGASTSDTVWNRNADGTAAYSWTIPQSSGDVVGTPTWDTINETTAGVDANGNGNTTDTDVRVLYIPTSTGHIIKLVDNGSSLARPASGAWASDFTDSNVVTITSALGIDGTNLYFGGTDSTTTKVFAVQVASGTNEAKLVKNIGSVSAVTTTPSRFVSSGSTYLLLGSTATSNQSYIYRVNVTSNTVDASYSGATTNINGAVVYAFSRAYAASDGGKLYALDALNFNSGGFTNVTGFPYTTSGSAAVKNPPWVETFAGNAYFGDDGGKVYAVTSSGSNITGYPYTISSSIKITSTPVYLTAGTCKGVIAVGANDGYLYFIDRTNGTGPNLFKRYFVTGAGSVSTVAFNNNTSTYMVSSSDGKLTFVNGADVVDPTPTFQ